MTNYREYILSDGWRKTTNRIKKRDGACLVCRRAVDLHVHHGTYQHLGKEFDEELFTLCAYHHDALHKAFEKHKKKKRKGSLFSFTRGYIERNGGTVKRNAPVKMVGVDIHIDIPIEEATGSFVDLFKRLAAQYPKKVAPAPTLPVKFKSRNQVVVEETLRRKAEKRRLKAERKRGHL